MQNLLRPLTALLFTSLALSGCLGDSGTDEDLGSVLDGDGPVNVNDLIAASPVQVLFEESVVTAALNYQSDLYEPTMDVCDDGSIYITGHTAVVDTTGAPVFGSHDDGETWYQLPFLQGQAMPNDLPGSTPPVTDEIFLSCGEDGWLFGVDITAATFPVNAWSDQGTRHAYYNPDAYDEHQFAAQAHECTAAPANDRPWGAYADGYLLMVSNPLGGPAQIGVLPVPFYTDAVAASLTPGVGIGTTTGGGRWNVCAGPGYSIVNTQAIPGIPDMRPGDNLFAVPQITQGELWLTMGYGVDVFQLQHTPVFETSSGYEITSRYGQAVFDGEGTLFVGVSNNTAPDTADNNNRNRTGGMQFAVSTDGGETFQTTTFRTDRGQALRHFYMDGNKAGTGSLVIWAIDGALDEGGEQQGFDWYMGHLFVGSDDTPELTNVARIIEAGPRPSAHVTGAAVGPDGRAYTAMFEAPPAVECAPGTPITNEACVDEPGHAPVSVYIQRDGPTLPVDLPAQ